MYLKSSYKNSIINVGLNTKEKDSSIIIFKLISFHMRDILDLVFGLFSFLSATTQCKECASYHTPPPFTFF